MFEIGEYYLSRNILKVEIVSTASLEKENTSLAGDLISQKQMVLGIRLSLLRSYWLRTTDRLEGAVVDSTDIPGSEKKLSDKPISQIIERVSEEDNDCSDIAVKNVRADR